MINKKRLFVKGIFLGLILVVTILVFFKGKISFNEKNNYQIAFYNGSQWLENMPLKGNAENLVYDHAICDNGATIEWDKDEWAPLVKGLNKNKTKCTLYFVEEKVIDLDKDIPLADAGKDGLYAVEHNNLTELGSEWNKTEYRYAGEDPDNYVEFNNEKWRIIGLVNVKTNTGVEQRLKIIRMDGIDGQKDFGKLNWNYRGLYTANNNWVDATLREILNGIYYESSSGDFYFSTGNVDEEVLTNYDFTGNGTLPKGLNEEARQMTDSGVIWNLGGSDIVDNITTDMFYEKERGTSSGNNNEYPNVWTMENDATYHKGVGIIYPSDYGYATHGGTVGREECFDNIYTLNKEDNYKTQCLDNNWLFNNRTYGNSDDLYTITPYVGNSWSNNITVILLPNIKDHVVGYGANMAAYVEPTLYLNKNVVIYDGDGTFNNPFKLKNE